MPKLPPLAYSRPEELRLLPMADDAWYNADGSTEATEKDLLGKLPVHPEVDECVHARYLSVHAILATGNTGEIRIPYVQRKQKGDFKQFMDALIDAVGDYPVRFSNVFMDDDEYAQAWDDMEEVFGVGPEGDDTQRIEEALNDFTHEQEQWDDEEPVDTLVGRWDPSQRGDA